MALAEKELVHVGFCVRVGCGVCGVGGWVVLHRDSFVGGKGKGGFWKRGRGVEKLVISDDLI